LPTASSFFLRPCSPNLPFDDLNRSPAQRVPQMTAGRLRAGGSFFIAHIPSREKVNKRLLNTLITVGSSE